MMHSVLLDTSFFIRLLDDEDSLHSNALDYFKYYLENDIVMKISTVSIAEYCTNGKMDELPLKNLQVIPFNIDHAKQTGSFAKIIFQERRNQSIAIKQRILIPNDSKLFAQADLDKDIKSFVTSDQESSKTISLLKSQVGARFDFIDITTPYHLTYGVLDF